jgi:hypothetical protein
VPEAAVGSDQRVPSAVERGEAERLLPVASPLGEVPEDAQHLREPRLGMAPPACTGPARCPVRSLHVLPQ